MPINFIDVDKFLAAVRKAHGDLATYLDYRPIDLPVLFRAPLFFGTRAAWAIRMAHHVGKVGPSVKLSTLPRGYCSWLMALPVPGIVVDRGQIRQWARDEGAPHAHLQEARVILHELGHVRLSPYLLASPGPGGLARRASPEEEELAWAYAMAVIALLLAAYARSIRETKNMDDAPSIMV